eukprot:TRINITY_DN1017_c0_g1_i1.p1 TRINITY_DN1017_c0_g1~~TRINITY_DN1017_c0_g1_i1.p1  ORF type:complete len:325 (+),score=51.09 TRINITY_DN1017_c0_g1_i1:95-1069(+)
MINQKLKSAGHGAYDAMRSATSKVMELTMGRSSDQQQQQQQEMTAVKVRDGLHGVMDRAPPAGIPTLTRTSEPPCLKGDVVHCVAETIMETQTEAEIVLQPSTPVTVLRTLGNGKILIRANEEEGIVNTEQLTHPFIRLKVIQKTGCNIRSSMTLDGPIIGKLLETDTVDIVRGCVVGGKCFLQTTRGAWVVSDQDVFSPVYLVNTFVIVKTLIQFDNQRRVHSGCIGLITNAPDTPEHCCEVFVDGVTWDARPHHIDLLIPQTTLSLSHSFDPQASTAFSDTESDTAPELSDGNSFSLDGDEADPFSEDSPRQVGEDQINLEI